MEEWKEYKLGELCNAISDTYKRGAKEVVLINTSDVLEGKCLNHVRVPNENLKGQFKKTFQYNDILYSEIRPANKRFAFVDFDATDYIASTKLMVLRHNDKITPQYLYYILKSQNVIEELQMLAESRSGTFPQITFSELSNLKVWLPNKKTQNKIFSILSSLDDKIEVNRRINEQLEELAQALFKSWFVDFEPFKDGEFVESELVKLGDVVKTTSGGTPSRKHMEYYGGNYGWVKSKELNGTFIVDTEETITDEAIAKSSAKLLPEKSILIAMYGATVGQYAILSKAMTCNQAVCALLPNDNYPYTYLFMFAKNKKDELINKAVGSAQQNISQILIKDLDISNDIQRIKDYHKIVSPAFEIIEKNQQEITHLTNLRDTLLPKLMSGEIDVEQFNVIE